MQQGDRRGIGAHYAHDMRSWKLLCEWCDQHNVLIDDRLELHSSKSADDGDQWSFALRAEIGEGELIVSIPKAATFSLRSASLCSLVDLIDPLDKIGWLELATCLVYEYSLGAQSPFWGYLQSLPDRVQLPSTSGRSTDWLNGTEASRRLAHKQSSPLRYWQDRGAALLAHVFPIKHEPPAQRLRNLHRFPGTTPTVNLFLDACSLVSSRSFTIDVHRGQALCPIADIFDHEEQNHVHVESELNRDAGSHQEDVTVIMRCVCYVSESETVYNSYGALDNADLLLRYGFALPLATDHERYSWAPSELPDDVKASEDYRIDAEGQLSSDMRQLARATVVQLLEQRIAHCSVHDDASQEAAFDAMYSSSDPLVVGAARHAQQEFVAYIIALENQLQKPWSMMLERDETMSI